MFLLCKSWCFRRVFHSGTMFFQQCSPCHSRVARSRLVPNECFCNFIWKQLLSNGQWFTEYDYLLFEGNGTCRIHSVNHWAIKCEWKLFKKNHFYSEKIDLSIALVSKKWKTTKCSDYHHLSPTDNHLFLKPCRSFVQQETWEKLLISSITFRLFRLLYLNHWFFNYQSVCGFALLNLFILNRNYCLSRCCFHWIVRKITW